MTNDSAYEIIRKSLTDAHLVRRIQKDGVAAIHEEGIEDPQQVQELLTIFSLLFAGASQQQSLAKKLEAQVHGTLAVATEMKTGLKRTLEQIDHAFRATMLMYQITFYLGVLLIVAAVVAAFSFREPLLPSVFGALGIIDILTFFLTKPQERLQSSRANLAQIQAALYNWFIDSINLNTLMATLQQEGKVDQTPAISETLMAHTEKTLEMLQKYCKLTGG